MLILSSICTQTEMISKCFSCRWSKSDVSLTPEWILVPWHWFWLCKEILKSPYYGMFWVTSFSVLKHIPLCVSLHFCFFWSYPHGRVKHWWLHTFTEAPKHRFRSGCLWDQKWPQWVIVQRGHHRDRRWQGTPGSDTQHVKDGQERAACTMHISWHKRPIWHKQMGNFWFLEVPSFCTFFICKLSVSHPETKPTVVFKWGCIMEFYSECLKFKVKVTLSCQIVCDPPWNSPGQNTGAGSLSLLQGILPTRGSNPSLPHCRQILYQLSHKCCC